MLALAAISAVGTALLGWMLAWSGGYQGPLVTRHMWGGLFLALSFPGRIALGHTDAWLTFARWLVR